ncbi:MAG: hypothetical protein NC548_54200 [Lachnospiraceae bacterium]|nr:hypothetical protein [Lachnospiraceae bacterium]
MTENEIHEFIFKEYKEVLYNNAYLIQAGRAFACNFEFEGSLATLLAMFDELQQYHSIGTVEECRDAREKQRAKIPNIWGDGYADGQLVYDMYDCPNCGESYEICYTDYDYCPKCGQRIDRGDLDRLEG